MFSLVLFLISIFNAHAITDPEGLKIGDKAPEFNMKDQNGKIVSLYKSLEKGNVILTFYRGAWCKYCMKQMKDYQDSLSLIRNAGAQLIAISPENEEGINKTVEKAGVTFSLIHDDSLQVMLDYAVISPEKVKDYRLKLKKTEEDISKKYLPVPALYIINRDGIIEFVSFNPDYKQRITVKEILSQLK